MWWHLRNWWLIAKSKLSNELEDFAKKILKQIAIIFNNLPTTEALKYLIQRITTTLVVQSQNADAEAGHHDSFIYFSFVLFLHCLYFHYQKKE